MWVIIWEAGPHRRSIWITRTGIWTWTWTLHLPRGRGLINRGRGQMGMGSMSARGFDPQSNVRVTRQSGRLSQRNLKQVGSRTQQAGNTSGFNRDAGIARRAGFQYGVTSKKSQNKRQNQTANTNNKNNNQKVSNSTLMKTREERTQNYVF